MYSCAEISYDMIKEQLVSLGMKDGPPLHLLTATLGGTIAVTICAPVDVIKSRLQANTRADVVSRAKVHIADRSLPGNSYPVDSGRKGRDYCLEDGYLHGSE